MDTETKDPFVAAIETFVDGKSDARTTVQPPPSKAGRGRRSRALLGLAFMGAGINHFLMPKTYERIVPPSMKGRAKDIVAVSGVAEFAGGLGAAALDAPPRGTRFGRVAGRGVSSEPVYGSHT